MENKFLHSGSENYSVCTLFLQGRSWRVRRGFTAGHAQGSAGASDPRAPPRGPRTRPVSSSTCCEPSAWLLLHVFARLRYSHREKRKKREKSRRTIGPSAGHQHKRPLRTQGSVVSALGPGVVSSGRWDGRMFSTCLLAESISVASDLRFRWHSKE